VAWKTANAVIELARKLRASLVCAVVIVALVGLPQAHALPINGIVNVAAWTVNNGPGGADPSIAQDFQFANQIYSQVGVSFNLANNMVIRVPPPGGLWTNAAPDYNITGAGQLFATNNVGAGPSPINVYYLPNYTSFGQAWGDEDLGPNVVRQGVVATSFASLAGVPPGNAGPRRTDTVAHELGHVLLNNWRWRSAETADNGIHSNDYTVATSPYVGNTGGLNLMASGAVRAIPAALNQAAPVGNLDQLNCNIGQNNGNAPLPNAVIPEVSALFNNNTTILNVKRDPITVTVGATTSAPFGWSLQQVVNGVTVNEGARISTLGPGFRYEDVFFDFRSSGVFVQGGGLVLGFGGLASLDAAYVGIVPNSLRIMTVDNIVNNPGLFTALTQGVQYNSALNFDPTTNTLTSALVNFTNLPGGQQDILMRLTLLDAVPEPSSLRLMGIGAMLSVLFGFVRTTNRRAKRLWRQTTQA